MIHLRDTRYGSTASLFADAIDIAEYYGFRPIDTLSAQETAKKPLSIGEVEDKISFARRDERLLPSVVRKALTFQKHPKDSVFFWRIGSGTNAESVMLELHCVGHETMMAEALLVVVMNAIADKLGIQNRVLTINNIGSNESAGRFMRDVQNYLRKHIDSISPTLRPKIMSEPVATLVQLIEKGHPAIGRAPQPMEYLTEEERRHFWNFLEYLEVLGLPYELNGQLLGSRDVWAHALYEMSLLDPESQVRLPFAFGGRYDPLASRFAKTPSHGVMMAISAEVKGSIKPRRSTRVMPAVFFAHLGNEARRHALPVLESLRLAEIPVYQSLIAERLGEQMEEAKRLKVPYVMILGHKEAMEKAVMVREVATNSQDTVPFGELANYLKRRKLHSGMVGSRA